MAALDLKQWLRDNIKVYLTEIKASIGSITGTYRGAFSTVAGMPTTGVKVGDWTILTADVVGTGTVDAPQYESGIYVRGAGVWQYVQDLQSFTEIITEMIATSGEYATGTSTTKAPSVAQVKSDVNSLQSQITAINTSITSAVEADATAANGWTTDIGNLDNAALDVDTTVTLSKFTQVGFVRKVAVALLTRIKAVNTALSSKAALGGSGSQTFLVAAPNALTNEAVNANNFNFTITTAEAAADYAAA